jgi:hypothetical protein
MSDLMRNAVAGHVRLQFQDGRGAGVVGVIGGLDARAGIKRALLRQRKEGRDYTGRTASKW